MDMVGHDDESIEKNVGIMGWQVSPAGGDDVTKVIGVHLAVDDVTEEAGSPLAAKRYVVRTRLGVIVFSVA